MSCSLFTYDFPSGMTESRRPLQRLADDAIWSLVSDTLDFSLLDRLPLNYVPPHERRSSPSLAYMAETSRTPIETFVELQSAKDNPVQHPGGSLASGPQGSVDDQSATRVRRSFPHALTRRRGVSLILPVILAERGVPSVAGSALHFYSLARAANAQSGQDDKPSGSETWAAPHPSPSRFRAIAPASSTEEPVSSAEIDANLKRTLKRASRAPVTKMQMPLRSNTGVLYRPVCGRCVNGPHRPKCDWTSSGVCDLNTICSNCLSKGIVDPDQCVKLPRKPRDGLNDERRSARLRQWASRVSTADGSRDISKS